MGRHQGEDDLPDRIESKPHAAHKLVDYASGFILPVYGKITVTLQKDGKALQMRYMTVDSRLGYYHYESFKGRVHDFVVKGYVFLTFVMGADDDVETAEAVLPGGTVPLKLKKTEAGAAPKEE
ncbi:hypothetical protein KI688_003803 [Linnemannia hyalina]|uniref:Peptidase S12 Pab87-related C-terminal domain-containing protein n=1 Tax=Linnemannia hyalina TaxID=64524 RepID=A0A9P7XMM6_9FUNG|nr:hypothetical protein KI688_003803 [Linnemannia hyalina]